MLFALFASPVTNQKEDNDNKESQNQPTNKTSTRDLEMPVDKAPNIDELDFDYGENEPNVVAFPIAARDCCRSSIPYETKLAAHTEPRQNRRSSIALGAHTIVLEENKRETNPEEKSCQKRNEEDGNKWVKNREKKKMWTLDSELQSKKMPNVENKEIFDNIYNKSKPKVLASTITAKDHLRTGIAYVPNLASHIEEFEELRPSIALDLPVNSLLECKVQKEPESKEGYQMRNKEGVNERIRNQTKKNLSTVDSKLQGNKIPNVYSDNDVLVCN